MSHGKSLPAQTRYVAHFDMLGFKTAVARNQNQAWGALCRLRRCMDGLSSITLEHMGEKRILQPRLTTRIFSDTILVFTQGKESDDLWGIVLLTAQLFSDAMASCIPLRGAVSYGDFFVNDHYQLYCGAPFVRAYELGERAQWCGIILDGIVAERFQNMGGSPLTVEGNIPTVIQWDVPLKEGKKETSWVVNWPMIFREGFRKNPPFSVEEYYSAFEPLWGSYENLPIDAQVKHQNTVDFLNTQFLTWQDTKATQ